MAGMSQICCVKTPLHLYLPKTPSFSTSTLISKRRRLYPSLATPQRSADSTSPSQQPPPPPPIQPTVLVGPDTVPLEGVIQFDKPPSRLQKWGRVALLAGGDVLALLLFSAIGRFSHGFSVFNFDTLRTADPFIAEDGRAMNGFSKAVIAAAKSWAVGIPLGLVIRSVTSGHVPSYPFILVTMGSTAVLLVGWRALSFTILPKNDNKKSDEYRRGSPFELFELLTSLVRRW